jgi:hypothetical protein
MRIAEGVGSEWLGHCHFAAVVAIRDALRPGFDEATASAYRLVRAVLLTISKPKEWRRLSASFFWHSS